MSERAVTLELPNCQATSGIAVVIERTLPARVARAAAIWGALWGAMLVCVFIPVLHFVLVPSLLLLGPIMGVLRVREAESLQAVRGRCPRCLLDRTFAASGRFKDGQGVHCDGCGNEILLRIQARAAISASPTATPTATSA